MKPAVWTLVAAAVLSLALAGLLAMALPVLAEPTFNCSDTRELMQYLDQGYGEKEAGQGVTLNGVLVRLLVGPKTFTIIATLPEGVSCPVFAGESWQEMQGGSL